MFGSIFTRYQNFCETRENHNDDGLKTHYYKGTYNQIFEKVSSLIQHDQTYRLEHVSKEHGEFSVLLTSKKQPYHFIITVVAVKPLEAAVDVHLSTEAFSLLGNYPFLKQEILAIYQKLNKIASLIGTGRSI